LIGPLQIRNMTFCIYLFLVVTTFSSHCTVHIGILTGVAICRLRASIWSAYISFKRFLW